MFRRSSKLTAMLVAAAAVVSIVPASATERLENKEGNITTGIAFDGGYIFDGYRTDEDDSALYYNKGDKDKNIDEDEDYDYDQMTKYGSKYALVEDSGEKYLVDLTAGKIEDDESLNDKYDDSVSKLRTALKKTDRYGKEFNENANLYLVDSAANINKTEFSSNATKEQKFVSGKFNDVWYMYSLGTKQLPNSADAKTDKGINNTIFGFTNENGKYIDASNLANLGIYSPSKGKTVKISEYGDTEDFGKVEITSSSKEEATTEKVDAKVSAKLESLKPLTQDKDYIYALATVSVSFTKDDGRTTIDVNGIPQTQYFLQKISKAQGDKKDGAYIPKSVTSYQIDGENTNPIFDNGDMHDASRLFIASNEAESQENENNTSEPIIPEGNYEVVNYTAKNGNIYVTAVDNNDNSVKVYTVKLKKAKVNSLNKNNKDIDVSAVMQDDDEDQDLSDLAVENENNTTLKNSAVSIDAEGNTWALDKGTIYKFDGSKFKEMYTCDRSINSLDVYDENNLIAWDSKGDVYAAITDGKKQTDDKEDESVAPVAKAGWDKNADGTWAFYQNGAKVTGWLNDNGTWYYLDAAGTMQTGWVNVNGTWYYLNPISNGLRGAMQTGWINDNGTWYYCNASGAMQTGWLLDGSTWYYLNANGSMAANTTVDGYVLGANGAWIR